MIAEVCFIAVFGKTLKKDVEVFTAVDWNFV